jgi:hypothetical protein
MDFKSTLSDGPKFNREGAATANNDIEVTFLISSNFQIE